MIILPWAAAGASTARMISRECFAFDLEKFSQWEVSIRLLSFLTGAHSRPLPLPLGSVCTVSLSNGRLETI